MIDWLIWSYGDRNIHADETEEQRLNYKMPFARRSKAAILQLTTLKPPSSHDPALQPCWRCTHPGEEGVETVDLLPLGHVGIVLGDALQGELLHQVDLIGLLQVLVLFRRIMHLSMTLHAHYHHVKVSIKNNFQELTMREHRRIQATFQY